MSLSWSRIALAALALNAASAVAGSAYQCTAANGAVTLAETCPPGTVNSRYLGDTGLPSRLDRDAYNPYSVMEQARRIDERRAAERQAAAERATASRTPDVRAKPVETAPPADSRRFYGGYDQSPYFDDRPGPPPWSPGPWGPHGRTYNGPGSSEAGNSIHPESADSHVRPGYRMGNGAPPAFQPQPNPRNGAMTPNYRHTPGR